jgi:CheY-like chemotaxis protein
MKSRNAKPATVLVVEDEPTVRVLAESIIEGLGYTILSAANAREAIALLEQDEAIDILFSDINLPDGPDAIDGLELARRAVELCSVRRRSRCPTLFSQAGCRPDRRRSGPPRGRDPRPTRLVAPSP